MTKVWLNVLNENQIGNNQISCLDFSQMGFNETYLPNSGIHREVTVKGFINALGIYTQSNKGKIYLAVINVPNYMMTAFSEVTISLAIKQFPNNLQLYIAEKRDGDKRASHSISLAQHMAKLFRMLFLFQFQMERKVMIYLPMILYPLSASHLNIL